MSTQNGVANTQPTSKIQLLKSMFDSPSVQEQFKNVLAENSGPFIASVIDLYNGDTYLQNCEPKTVIMECLKAAILKLPINKSLGFAYIVPYKKANVTLPQFQIGYKGLIQLAMRTGQYRIINADIVYEGEFRTRNKLTGEFDLSGVKKSDNIVGYFAYIEMLNGFSKTLYMTKEKVTAHAQKYSKSFNTQFSPWKTEFDAMAIKTVLRNLLSHYGFLSVEMMNSIIEEGDEVSEKVRSEINGNANATNVSFQEADVVQEQEEQPETEFATNGPGF